MSLLEEKYFNNLFEIENQWKILKNKNFPLLQKDNFWGLCIKGRMLFWDLLQTSNDFKNPLPKTVPAYQRAVMLLEYEKKYQNAIRLCEEANKLGINTDWYTKKINKFKKLIEKGKK